MIILSSTKLRLSSTLLIYMIRTEKEGEESTWNLMDRKEIEDDI